METKFNFSNVVPSLSIRGLVCDILDKYDEVQIYRYYFGQDFQLGKKYNSPFRKDNDPSFGFFLSTKSGMLLCQDLGSGEVYNMVTFVGKLYNISYAQAAIKIATDFDILENAKKANLNPIVNKHLSKFSEDFVKQEYKFTVVLKEFSEKELNWWKTFNITRDILREFNVGSAKSIFINKIERIFKGMKFVYKFPKVERVKIYCPEESRENKWRGNVNSVDDVYGYFKLPNKGELLIITKSLKDVMCLYSLGYTAVSFQSETYNPSREIIDELKSRFKKVVTLYDNDEAGKKKSSYFKDTFDIDIKLIPNEYETKDISDTVARHGVDISSKLLKILLNGGNKEQNP